jgi:hypothetical protein
MTELWAYCTIDRTGRVTGVARYRGAPTSEAATCIAATKEEAQRMVRYIQSAQNRPRNIKLFYFANGVEIDAKTLLD